MRRGHDATGGPTGLAAIGAHTGIIGAHAGISGAYARRLMLVAFVVAVMLMCAGARSASAASGWWRIESESSPTNLAGEHKGEVTLQLSDLGDAAIEGGDGNAITISDRLPAGITAIAVSEAVKNGVEMNCSIAANVVTCTFPGHVNPYEQLPVNINVENELPAGTVATLDQEVHVEGAGVASAVRTLPLQVSSAPTPFGVAGFELAPFNEDGTPAVQAGSQPFQLTTSLVLDQEGARFPAELPKNLSFDLPPGLLGNPSAVEQCPLTDFAALVEETNLCPASSVVGVATVVAHEPATNVLQKTVPVFNLVPSRGEPARFGFEVFGKVPIVIDTAVRSGRDYGVVVNVKEATETAGVLSTQVTLWGDPGNPEHNSQRGWECVAGGFFAKQAKKGLCPTTSAETEKPFLTLPTSCASDPESEPFTARMDADSWAAPEVFAGAEYSWSSLSGQLLGFEGCGELPFSPAIDVTPAQHTASTPSGLKVNVSVPQQSTLTPGGLAEADIRDTTVTLPAGVTLNPSAANGLEACSESQIGYTGYNPSLQINEFNTSPVSCPDGSKLGTVKITTPLLTHPLEGYVYLATPAPNGEGGENPFGSLVALYLVAEDPVSGVLVKLAGEGVLNEETLRVATTFRNTPQVPFEALELNLFDGPRASLSTPAACGQYTTEALFTPWSGTPPVSTDSPAGDFAIEAGVSGGACPSGEPFSPGFLAQSQNPQAGAFSSFVLELSRADGEQALRGVSMHLPPGIAAMLSSVTLCSQAQASADACPPDSEVGQATAIAGLGPDPYTEQGGRVFITGPYQGDPFGLEIVTPAVAGPFNLGTVTVRSGLSIDPNNASVTITSDPLPTQLRGIPLQLKRVLVTVDRPDFEFNPTGCGAMKVEGTITGSAGTKAQVSSPFQVAGCRGLPFSPKLTASAVGHGSKAVGTTFKVTVRSGGVGAGGVAQSGIAKVNLQLPKQLSSRLPTLQKACSEAAFDTNPASCDEGSVIGIATIHTPILRSPLSGPAYLVSHGNAAFPERRVRAPRRRHHAGARWQDPDQEPGHVLQVRIHP